MAWIQTGSTIIFKPYTLEEALRGLAEAGFENVEIGAVKGFLEHLDPDNLTDEVIEETRALLDRHRLRCVSMSRHRPTHGGGARRRPTFSRPERSGILVPTPYRGRRDRREVRRSVTRDRRQAERRHRPLHQTNSNLLPAARSRRAPRRISHLDPDQLRPGNVVYYAGRSPEDLRTRCHVSGTSTSRTSAAGVLDFRRSARRPTSPGCCRAEGGTLLRASQHGDRVHELRVAVGGIPRRGEARETWDGLGL
jgi:hypothetical protein